MGVFRRVGNVFLLPTELRCVMVVGKKTLHFNFVVRNPIFSKNRISGRVMVVGKKTLFEVKVFASQKL
jgi:hypothetical protein